VQIVNRLPIFRNWVHEIKPPLPRGFDPGFISPRELEKRVVVVQKPEVEDDADEVVVKTHHGCCIIS
jgi:hypothetical protein